MAERRLGKYVGDYVDNDFLNSFIRWQSDAYNVLDLRFTRNSPQFTRFLSSFSMDYLKTRSSINISNIEEDLARANGVLTWIVNSLKEGFVDDLFFKKELEVF